jgi:hypothetical protein
MVDFRKRLQMTEEEEDMLYSGLMSGKDGFPSDYSFAEEFAPSEDQSPQEDFADRETDIAVLIVGRLCCNEYTDKEGKKGRSWYVTVSQMQMIGDKRESKPAAASNFDPLEGVEFNTF